MVGWVAVVGILVGVVDLLKDEEAGQVQMRPGTRAVRLVRFVGHR